MSGENYIYAPTPSVAHQFRCRVPMKGTRQIFIVDGGVQGTKNPFSFIAGRGKIMDEFLQVISIRTEDSPLQIKFENNIVLEEDSSAKILLCSHTFSHDRFVTDETINISLKEGAEGDIVLMQNEHNLATHSTLLNIDMAASATLKMSFITLHGGTIKNTIIVNLNGEHSKIDLSGLYLVDGEQLVENNLTLFHKVPNCVSNQLFKGILDNKSVARFNGIIKVIPDAQKTEAFQANHNLLLSNDAKIYTQPQLEIYADDVKCSHGATIGRLDIDELFYMRSRGISAHQAKLLQQMAFTYSVLEKISNTELRERMLSLVEKRLRGEFTDCKNCSKNCC